MLINNKKYYLIAYEGKIFDILTAEEFSKKNMKASIAELDLSSLISSDGTRRLCSSTIGDIKSQLKESVNPYYWANVRKNGFGAHGDLISVSTLESDSVIYWSLDFIGELAYRKPAFAADLVIFIKDNEGRNFFVGIERANPPGLGKISLIGGMVDNNGLEMEKFSSAAIREVGEEVNLELNPNPHCVSLPGPFPETVKLISANGCHEKNRNVVFDNRSVSDLHQVGMFFTGEEEINHTTNRRRVSATVGYTVVLAVDKPLSEEIVAAYFVAADDAKRIIVKEIKGLASCPDFGISHHFDIYKSAYNVAVVRAGLLD